MWMNHCHCLEFRALQMIFCRVFRHYVVTKQTPAHVIDRTSLANFAITAVTNACRIYPTSFAFFFTEFFARIREFTTDVIATVIFICQVSRQPFILAPAFRQLEIAVISAKQFQMPLNNIPWLTTFRLTFLQGQKLSLLLFLFVELAFSLLSCSEYDIFKASGLPCTKRTIAVWWYHYWWWILRNRLYNERSPVRKIANL